MRPLLEWLDRDGFYVDTVWDQETGSWGEAGLIQLFPHQRRIFAHCFTPDAKGKFPYTTIVYSCPKKSGKSKLAAMVAAWYAENSRDNMEICMVANDKDQATRLTFSDVVYHAEHHLGLKSTAYRIVYPNGTYVQALANQYSSAAGGRMGLTVWDELWAYCRTPVPVLTADLQWVMSDQLKVGDRVVSFDEERGEHTYRSFKTGMITAHNIIQAPTLRVRLENGQELVGTPTHKLLCRHGKHNDVIWIELQNLQPGDRVMKVIEPWEELHSEAQGYLAAAFDGEGSLCQTRHQGVRLDFAQRNNAMLHQVDAYLSELGYRFWHNKTNGGTNHDVCGIGIAQKHQVIKFLGQIRPRRLLSNFHPEGIGRMMAAEYLSVISVEDAGTQAVVAMTVDAGTYIGEGFADHNTTENSRRMWSEMAVPPTVPNAMRFIATYAGFENESDQLLDLYNMCFKKENGEYINGEVVPELADLVNSKGEPVCRRNQDTFIYWDTEPRMPWQTPLYYESQMMTIRPSDFLRMHRNMWVSSSESFIPIELWDRAARHLTGPATLFKEDIRRTYPVSVGIDIGMKHDCSALVGVYWDAGKRRAGVAFARIWTPPKEGMLDLEFTVEEELLRLSREFKVVSVVYDPAQFQRSAVTLQRKGMPMIEYPNTAGNMMLATQALYDLLKNDTLDAYPDPELRDHIRYASAETTSRGFRLVKGKNAKFKIDAAIALAMACFDAINRGGVDTTLPVQIISPFSDATAVHIPTIADQFTMQLPEALRD